MGYVAVEAGEELIERAADLFEKQRLDAETEPLSVDAIDGQLDRLTAQAAGEGGVYAPRLAALAVKQAQGDAVEAAFLLRAYRSTLERWGATETVATDEAFTIRRVSPAYKDVPGGQVLGPTKDYTRRLLDFELDGESDPDDPTADWDLPDGAGGSVDGDDEADGTGTAEGGELGRLADTLATLRERGLVPEPAPPEGDDGWDEPADTTRESVTQPPGRDEVLQELARGETGAVTALGYSALRGYGQVHPTLAEVRVAALPVAIEHPYTGERVRVTDCEVTECEAVVPAYEDRDDAEFALGYGLTFGRNERKAIAASVLDAGIQFDGTEAPAEDPEFVLDVVDGMDAFGFIEHLKLPHYVTFQSILDRIESARADGPGGDRDGEGDRDGDRDESGDDDGDDGAVGTPDAPDGGPDPDRTDGPGRSEDPGLDGRDARESADHDRAAAESGGDGSD
jgi:alpha-D-ribose 1-methylphosphonate 5-triphosphate synthase subunit PhnI